jgi:hypothetical protein
VCKYIASRLDCGVALTPACSDASRHLRTGALPSLPGIVRKIRHDSLRARFTSERTISAPTITSALKNAIRQSGLSLYQISAKSGVSNPVIYRFMMGERDIRLATADKLFAVLDLRVMTT